MEMAIVGRLSMFYVTNLLLLPCAMSFCCIVVGLNYILHSAVVLRTVLGTEQP